jgi:putative sigma-54 modulation protein
MNLELTTRNVELTPTIEKRLRRALEKLSRVLDDAAKVHVILGAEKHRFLTEVLVIWRDRQFTGTAEADDLHSSVTEAIDRLLRQTLKQKEKFAARRRMTRKLVKTLPAESPAPEVRIIRTPRYSVKPLTPDEAADLLLKSSDHFLVFRNSETERVAVLYKRNDGHLGLIEP